MRPTNIILVGSTNKGKLEEYKTLCTEWPEIECRKLTEMAWNPRSFRNAEKGKTYLENALSKGRLAHKAGRYPTLAEDTGLEVDALDGRPGVFSRRYATPNEGESQDHANVRKLLEELKGVPKEKRTARFVCTTVFLLEGVFLKAEGKLEGQILEIPRGVHGFGYDPVFYVPEFDKSLAEMTQEEKNKVSHRAVAFRDILKQIKEKNIQLVHP